MVVAEAVQKSPEAPSCIANIGPAPVPYPENGFLPSSRLSAAIAVQIPQRPPVLQLNAAHLQRIAFEAPRQQPNHARQFQHRPVLEGRSANNRTNTPERRCRRCNGYLIYDIDNCMVCLIAMLVIVFTPIGLLLLPLFCTGVIKRWQCRKCKLNRQRHV